VHLRWWEWAGFLAATTHAPLTAVLMIFEMTLDHQVVLPLILACVTAHYVAKVYRGGCIDLSGIPDAER